MLPGGRRKISLEIVNIILDYLPGIADRLTCYFHSQTLPSRKVDLYLSPVLIQDLFLACTKKEFSTLASYALAACGTRSGILTTTIQVRMNYLRGHWLQVVGTILNVLNSMLFRAVVYFGTGYLTYRYATKAAGWSMSMFTVLRRYAPRWIIRIVQIVDRIRSSKYLIPALFLLGKWKLAWRIIMLPSIPYDWAKYLLDFIAVRLLSVSDRFLLDVIDKQKKSVDRHTHEQFLIVQQEWGNLRLLRLAPPPPWGTFGSPPPPFLGKLHLL